MNNIWIYWDSGFDNSPDIVKVCKKSWEYHNPNYKINVLSDDNVLEYISKDVIRPKSKAAWSDVLRINLLKHYGGIWVDATVFCNKPLDDWLYQYNQNGFFAFSEPAPNRKICSWFLYSEKDNYIVDKFYNKVNEYWSKRKEPHDYYWFHSLYDDLYDQDNTVKQYWDLNKKYKANWNPLAEDSSNPHYFAPYFQKRLNTLTDDSLKAPVYKLRHGSSNDLMANTLIKKLIGNIL